MFFAYYERACIAQLFMRVSIYGALKQVPELKDKVKTVKMTYDGPERRSEKSFEYDATKRDRFTRLRGKTGFTFFHEPGDYDWDKRDKGVYGKHFVPRRGAEPKNLFSSGVLEPVSIGPVRRNYNGQEVGGAWAWGVIYDYDAERYSRDMFPDRRNPMYNVQRKEQKEKVR